MKKIKNILVVLLKLLYLYLKASLTKKNKTVVLVPEFDFGGGALTYFGYITNYFETNNISYRLVISENQKIFIEKNFKLPGCIQIITGPAVWRPYFSTKNGVSKNIDLLLNQLHELLFFSKLNVKIRPDYFFYSITNPEHYLFEFCLNAKILYACHTSPADKMDAVKKLLLNTNLSKNKKIIAVSHFEKEEMICSWGIKKTNSKYITVIHNYYNKIGKRDGKQTEIKKENAINVLTIGSVEYFKNPGLWISVAKKFTDSVGRTKINFSWVGSGSLIEECKKEVKAYPNIQFEGYKENVDGYYQNTDIYLQPSLFESFGISVAGAMAYKIPCIVSESGALTELIDDNVSGFLIKNQDVKNYLIKLGLLYENPKERVEMGNKGFAKFSENFTKQSWTKNMDALFV